MNITIALSITLTATAALAAQGPPTPAPELKKLDVLAGAFTGKGVVRPTADAEPLNWTSQSTGQWILGGQVLEERMTVDFPEGGFPPLQFRSFFGWDRETGRYVNLGVSNMGPIELQPVHFVNPNEFAILAVRNDQGGPMGDHSSYKFNKDGYEFVMRRIDLAGNTSVHVSGSFKRATTAAAAATEASFKGEASPELQKLSRMLGTWKIAGKMIPAPGAPSMAISGIETETLGFGGNVIVGHVLGDPIPGMGPAYEAWGFLSWDPVAKAYASGHVSNMGEIGIMQGALVDGDKVVFTSAANHMGNPSATRGTIELGADTLRWTSDRFVGTAPAVRDFEATYTRTK